MTISINRKHKKEQRSCAQLCKSGRCPATVLLSLKTPAVKRLMQARKKIKM
jgi:hypothetical protein